MTDADIISFVQSDDIAEKEDEDSEEQQGAVAVNRGGRGFSN